MTMFVLALAACLPADRGDLSTGGLRPEAGGPPPIRMACTDRAVIASTGNRYGDLQDALDAAGPGDVVAVCPGTHRGPYEVRVPVTLGGVGDVVLDAQGEGPALTAPGGTTILDLALTGGSGDRGGGLSVTEPGEIVLARVTLRGNRAAEGGGFALPPGASAALFDVRVAENEAERGGGIYVEDAHLTAAGADLVGNVAARGGALACAGGVASLVDTTLRDNRAEHGGGAFAEVCTVEGGGIIGNEALDYGGGLVLLESVAAGIEVRGNRASFGGGIYALASDIDAAVVAGNEGGRGAGVFAISGVSLAGTRILDHAGIGLEVGAGRVDLRGGAVLGNEVGAFSDGGLDQVLSSSGADWGADDSDNAHDVAWGFDVFVFGPDATFTCTAGACGG